MRSRQLRAAAAVLGLVILAGGDVTGGQQQPGPGTKPFLFVAIRSIDARNGGGPEAQTRWELTAGTPSTLYVTGGNREHPEMCAINSGGKTLLEHAAVAWIVEASLKSVEAAGAKIDVRWRRVVTDLAGIDAADTSQEYEMTMTEGTRVVLDLVRPRTATPTGCAGVVVETWFDFQDAPGLENALLDYEIWLVHKDAEGRELTDQTGGRGLQGKSVAYFFRTMRYAADGTARADGELALEFGGSVKGRARPDGRIDLIVQAGRMAILRGLGSGDGGSQQVTVRDGEVVGVELPPYSDSRFEKILAGQRTSIRVKVRRIG